MSEQPIQFQTFEDGEINYPDDQFTPEYFSQFKLHLATSAQATAQQTSHQNRHTDQINRQEEHERIMKEKAQIERQQQHKRRQKEELIREQELRLEQKKLKQKQQELQRKHEKEIQRQQELQRKQKDAERERKMQQLKKSLVEQALKKRRLQRQKEEEERERQRQRERERQLELQRREEQMKRAELHKRQKQEQVKRQKLKEDREKQQLQRNKVQEAKQANLFSEDHKYHCQPSLHNHTKPTINSPSHIQAQHLTVHIISYHTSIILFLYKQTSFLIQVQLPHHTPHQISRKFSHFVQLASALRLLMPGALVPPIVSNSILQTVSSKINISTSHNKYLSARKVKLQMFLNFCLHNPPIAKHPLFLQFLSTSYKGAEKYLAAKQLQKSIFEGLGSVNLVQKVETLIIYEAELRKINRQLELKEDMRKALIGLKTNLQSTLKKDHSQSQKKALVLLQEHTFKRQIQICNHIQASRQILFKQLQYILTYLYSYFQERQRALKMQSAIEVDDKKCKVMKQIGSRMEEQLQSGKEHFMKSMRREWEVRVGDINRLSCEVIQETFGGMQSELIRDYPQQ